MLDSKIKFGNVTLDKNKPEQFTQSYQAGLIVASINYYYPKEKLNLVQCLVFSHSLQDVIGGKLWMKLKAKRKTRHFIALYEKFAWSPGKPLTVQGEAKDFMIAYGLFFNRIRRVNRTFSKPRVVHKAI